MTLRAESALASWLVGEKVEGATVAPEPLPELAGSARRVPFARDAERIVVVAGGAVHVIAREDVRIEPGVNLADEPRDTVILDGVRAEPVHACDPDALRLRGALTRARQMADALARVSEMSVAYAGERKQFGRPIARFQAVQQHLVTIAQHAALAGVAVARAEAREGAFEIAAAKLLANRAALVAGRGAHQVHGARGTTRDHPLHEDTRRLWAWRAEYGDETYWRERLGAAVTAAGADRLYPAITGGSAVLEV